MIRPSVVLLVKRVLHHCCCPLFVKACQQPLYRCSNSSTEAVCCHTPCSTLIAV